MSAVVKKEDCSICNNGKNLNFTITTGDIGTKIVEVKGPEVVSGEISTVECLVCKREKKYKITYCKRR